MDKSPSGLEWWLWLFGYAFFAAFGGALGYIMRTLDAKSPVLWWRVLFEMLCAAFAGILVVFICQAMGMSTQWTGVVVGVFGWLGGSAAMRYLETVVTKKIGARDGQSTGNGEGRGEG